MLCESPISKNKSRSKAFESDSFHLSLPEYCQKQNTTEAVNWSSATAYYCKSSVMICSQMYFFETYYCFKLFNWLIKVLLCNRFFSKKYLIANGVYVYDAGISAREKWVQSPKQNIIFLVKWLWISYLIVATIEMLTTATQDSSVCTYSQWKKVFTGLCAVLWKGKYTVIQ